MEMAGQNAWDVSSIETIFFVPISSIIKADFFAAQQFLDYIQSFGFSGEENESSGNENRKGFIGDLRMTSFRFRQSTEGGQSEDRFLRVPALSMIPLPLLQVKEANFDFAVRVVQAQREDPPGPVLLNGKPNDDVVDDCNWKAMLVAERSGGKDSPDGSSTSYVNANIKVKMKVHQSDMPAGISRLLAVMNDNAQIVSARLVPDSANIHLSPGDEQRVTLYAFDYSGEPVKDAPIQRTGKPASQFSVSVDGKLWSTSGTQFTDSDGKLELTVSSESEMSRERPVSTKLEFAGLIEGARVHANVNVSID